MSHKRKPQRRRPEAPVEARERNVRATPETLRHLEPDIIDVLERHGTISGAEITAVFDIRRAFELITWPVRLRVAALQRIDCGGGDDGIMAADVTRLRNYNDWVDLMTERRLAVGPVLDTIVDGKSFRKLAREWGVDRRTLSKHFVLAMRLYCVVAGWLTIEALKKSA